jgi:transcriptional regulator with XRE-family HTH domain
MDGKYDNGLVDSFGEQIKNFRKKRGLMLKELSEKSKISPAYLSRLESNKRNSPSNAILMKLARALDISIVDLVKIFLEINEPVIKDIKEVLLDCNYTIGGKEVSKEMRILLCEIIECITSDEWKHQDISNVHYQKLAEIIKDLNKLL